uniref:Arginine vasopressin receptor 2 n=1 Tax=Mesocestoides corti TaxID=53468 RepID=A0A5K3FD56_MESCO
GGEGGSIVCCDSCLFTALNPVAPLPTQSCPLHSMSPAAGILNSLSFPRPFNLDCPPT